MRHKKKRSRLFRAFMLCCLAFALGLVATVGINAYVVTSAKERVVTAEAAAGLDADCILVLGSLVWDSGAPSPLLRERLAQGVALYEAGASGKLLMSGDHGKKQYDEVNAMKQYAVNAGVPSGDVFMDHAGFSTYESMCRVRDVFQAKKVIIVTQEYHMSRSLYIARQLGLDAHGVTAAAVRSGQNRRDAREILARVKDFFYVMARPSPTYLGDAIPVSGNGNLTNDRDEYTP